jgi:hypothetical protein
MGLRRARREHPVMQNRTLTGRVGHGLGPPQIAPICTTAAIS